MTLLDNYLEITTARPFLLVSWSEDRHSFHDIRVFRDESELMARKQMIRSHVVDTVPVPDDDWITGFIFRQEPVKLGAGTADTCRFFHASENHFIVGFRCYRDDEDHSLTHMKLLEQPLTNVGDCPRVSDRSVGGYNTTQGFWAGDLPPRNVCTSKNHLRLTWSYMGYNYPTEWLMLGESAEEQADITGSPLTASLAGLKSIFKTNLRGE
ncbi:unnamed protein product [Clonostachys rosea f. rosea IK726]|uniref:Uncharacterized protein n=1 Tax=Clonostachys rosea f. rosea IK726 TaxID=1349383 RepID=A0ACA9U9V0_BIOOC|nr:unnamed protein product [Clonostachys rosea f. rosea IK726]